MSDERLPGASPGSPTDLQQLQAALAAGIITPELFATLSAQLPPPVPAAPPAVPAPRSAAAAPSGQDAELPSLLDMFNQAPAAPASLPPPGRPAPPVAQPTPTGPPQPSAAEVAARQRIEEDLARLRQRPAAPAAPAAPNLTPTPTPNFYAEPPAAAPNFYPTHPLVEAASPPPARPAPPRPSAVPAEPATSGTSRWLWLLLLGLAVAGALAYFFIQNSHPDETLTSPSLSAAAPAPTKAAAPTAAKKTRKSSKKKRKKKAHTPLAAASKSEAAPADARDEVATASPPATTAAPPASEAPAPGSRHSPPAAPEAGDDAATIKIRTVLAAYYADLLAPPLHASQYFAPQVERLYIQQNLTPAAINAELARSFFPENQQTIARIEPGTLRVSPPAADGSRTATFVETMRLYRVSLRKNQQLRTQVRARFNADYQIVYMRQEKLLANTFE